MKVVWMASLSVAWMGALWADKLGNWKAVLRAGRWGSQMAVWTVALMAGNLENVTVAK